MNVSLWFSRTETTELLDSNKPAVDNADNRYISLCIKMLKKYTVFSIFWSVLLWALLPQSLLAGDLDGVKLHWKAPLKYSNGERLLNARRELSEYRIYFGATREGIRSEYIPVSSAETSYPLQQIGWSKLKSPIVYLAVSAVARSGQESDLSEIVFFLP